MRGELIGEDRKVRPSWGGSRDETSRRIFHSYDYTSIAEGGEARLRSSKPNEPSDMLSWDVGDHAGAGDVRPSGKTFQFRCGTEVRATVDALIRGRPQDPVKYSKWVDSSPSPLTFDIRDAAFSLPSIEPVQLLLLEATGRPSTMPDTPTAFRPVNDGVLGMGEARPNGDGNAFRSTCRCSTPSAGGGRGLKGLRALAEWTEDSFPRFFC